MKQNINKLLISIHNQDCYCHIHALKYLILATTLMFSFCSRSRVINCSNTSKIIFRKMLDHSLGTLIIPPELKRTRHKPRDSSLRRYHKIPSFQRFCILHHEQTSAYWKHLIELIRPEKLRQTVAAPSSQMHGHFVYVAKHVAQWRISTKTQFLHLAKLAFVNFAYEIIVYALYEMIVEFINFVLVIFGDIEQRPVQILIDPVERETSKPTQTQMLMKELIQLCPRYSAWCDFCKVRNDCSITGILHVNVSTALEQCR